MHRPQRGILCAGCPHRAAFVVVRQVVRRGRGRVYCGDVGCPAVGPVHPAAATVDGGDGALLPRYRQEVPDGSPEARARVCAHFIGSPSLMSPEAAERLSHIGDEGDAVLLSVLASSKPHLSEEGLESLVEHVRGIGVSDVHVADPFDTLGCEQLADRLVAAGGAHAIVFASPCAQLMGDRTGGPADIDRYACVGCHRCKQITGCPALSFTPPVYSIDPGSCAGCDLCCDFCRTHVIYSPRQRMTLDERREARYASMR